MSEHWTRDSWNAVIRSLPDPHLLQTWEWAQLKARYGWAPLPQVWRDPSGRPVAAAMVLRRALPIRGLAARLCVLYVPRGPLLDWSDASLRARVLDDLQALARQQGAIFLKLDPEVPLGSGVPGEPDAVEHPVGQAYLADLRARGAHFSGDQVQFRNTALLDLDASEDDLLARMKQKTRYNIRLAQKKGVTVRPGGVSDLALLYRMYAETALRDGFAIREEGYYRAVWETFLAGDDPACHPLIAEAEGEPLAALVLFRFGARAWYLYGMSREVKREWMPNYLLQWEAIRMARSLGCRVYDLWGAPDEFHEGDRLWGVFRFKQGLGGRVLRTPGAWDFVPNPLWYRLYTEIVPRLLDVMRAQGRARTKQVLG